MAVSKKIISEEDKVMPEVLRAMHRMGGQVTRKEIMQEIRENSQVIDEKEIDRTRTSRKTGNPWYPFKTRFNYAIRHLILAGYINTADNRYLELSKKGRTVDLANFDPTNDVRALSDPLWPNGKKAAQKAPTTAEPDSDHEVPDDPDEVAEEPWRQELLTALQKMSPKKFELFCRGLLKQMGVEVDDAIGVQYVADGGLDGFGYVRADDFRTTRVALQAKRWNSKVSGPEIDKFRGAMDKYRAEFGIFITNSDFTRDAVATSREGTRIITLINGDQICDLVAKYQYYVEPVTTYRLKDFYLETD